MLQYIFYSSILIGLFTLSACTKVITLHLPPAAPAYVIEGNITDEPGPYTVQITQTTGFYSGNDFTGVAGAIVQVSDTTGYAETLVDKGNGLYVTQHLQGVQGMRYSLHVAIGKDTFTAVSTMPYRINLDSIYVAPVYNSGKTILAIVPSFLNPPAPGVAYYFFNQTINGNLDKTLYYWNSKYSSGLQNTFNLERNSADSTLHTGDSVQIEMQCIDEQMYNYWSGMDQSASGGGGAYPGDPVTNLSKGALGYFSAHTSQTRRLKVQ